MSSQWFPPYTCYRSISPESCPRQRQMRPSFSQCNWMGPGISESPSLNRSADVMTHWGECLTWPQQMFPVQSVPCRCWMGPSLPVIASLGLAVLLPSASSAGEGQAVYVQWLSDVIKFKSVSNTTQVRLLVGRHRSAAASRLMLPCSALPAIGRLLGACLKVCSM